MNNRGSTYQPPPPPRQGGGIHRNLSGNALPRRWYHSTAFVIVSLVVVFPLGLVLLWKSPLLTRRMKIIASSIVGGVVALVLILILILLLRGDSKPKPGVSPSPPTLNSTSTSIRPTTTTSTTTTTTTTTTVVGGSGSTTTQQDALPVPNESSEDSSVYFPTCAAAKAAGVAPLYIGEPGYRPGLDRDKDGKACE
jgi:hypothetical protein